MPGQQYCTPSNRIAAQAVYALRVDCLVNTTPIQPYTNLAHALPCQAVCACRARVLRVCRSCVHACVCASVRASVHLCVDRSVRPSILPIFSMPAQPLARMQDEDEDESDIDSMINQDDLEDIEEALQAQLDSYDSEISNDGATGPPVYPSIHPSIHPSVCLSLHWPVRSMHTCKHVRACSSACGCACAHMYMYPCAFAPLHACRHPCVHGTCVCVCERITPDYLRPLERPVHIGSSTNTWGPLKPSQMWNFDVVQARLKLNRFCPQLPGKHCSLGQRVPD